MKQHKTLSAKEASNVSKNKRIQMRESINRFNTMDSIMKRINFCSAKGGNTCVVDGLSKEVKKELLDLGYIITDNGRNPYSLNRERRDIWIQWA